MEIQMAKTANRQHGLIIFWLTASVAVTLVYLYIFVFLPQSPDVGPAYFVTSILFLFLYGFGFTLAIWVRRTGDRYVQGEGLPSEEEASSARTEGSVPTAFFLVAAMPALAYMCLQGIAYLVAPLLYDYQFILIPVTLLKILPLLTAYLINRLLPLSIDNALAFFTALPVITLVVILWGSRLIMMDLNPQTPNLFPILLWPAIEIILGISVAIFSRLGTKHSTHHK